LAKQSAVCNELPKKTEGKYKKRGAEKIEGRIKRKELPTKGGLRPGRGPGGGEDG